MTARLQDLIKDVSNPSDAFWYKMLWRLGTLQELILKEKIKQPVWRSSNGTVNTPASMSDKHLYNMVQSCFRQHEEGEPLPLEFAAFQEELKKRNPRRLQALSDRFHQRVPQVTADPEMVRMFAQRMLNDMLAKAAAAKLPDTTSCMLCGFTPQPTQLNQLRPWIPEQLKTMRCIEAKACQGRAIKNKLALLVEEV